MYKVAAWHTEVPHAMWSGQTKHGIRHTTAGQHATGGMRRCGAGRAPAAILHGCCVLHVVGCTACGRRTKAPLRRTGRCETSVRQHATHKYAPHNAEHTTQNACAIYKKKSAVPCSTGAMYHGQQAPVCTHLRAGGARRSTPVQHAAQRYNMQRNTPRCNMRRNATIYSATRPVQHAARTTHHASCDHCKIHNVQPAATAHVTNMPCTAAVRRAVRTGQCRCHR